MKSFRFGKDTHGVAAIERLHSNDEDHVPHTQDLLALIERISTARKDRSTFLDADLFSDPGWDMLVQLFHADLAGYRLTISNLAIACSVPLTTALRWMDTLIKKGLAVRRNNPLDARSVFIEITDAARARMYDYLCATWATYYA